MLFSSRLRETRIDKGITQGQLAQMCGITLRTIQYYEFGKRMPNSMEITTMLADALGVSTQYLLGEEENTYKTVVEIPLVGVITCGPVNFAEENVEER